LRSCLQHLWHLCSFPSSVCPFVPLDLFRRRRIKTIRSALRQDIASCLMLLEGRTDGLLIRVPFGWRASGGRDFPILLTLIHVLKFSLRLFTTIMLNSFACDNNHICRKCFYLTLTRKMIIQSRTASVRKRKIKLQISHLEQQATTDYSIRTWTITLLPRTALEPHLCTHWRRRPPFGYQEEPRLLPMQPQ
jgi:hypothetical protein